MPIEDSIPDWAWEPHVPVDSDPSEAPQDPRTNPDEVERVAKLVKKLEGCFNVSEPLDRFSIVTDLGQNAPLQWLAANRNRLSDLELASYLPGLWVSANMKTGGPRGFTRDIALEIYGRTGYLSDWPIGSTPVVPPSIPLPTGPIDVYHGVLYAADASSPSRVGNMWYGMAWTTKYSVAQDFAKRTKMVLKATVQPGSILAQYHSEDEDEVVLDPGLVDAREIDVAPYPDDSSERD